MLTPLLQQLPYPKESRNEHTCIAAGHNELNEFTQALAYSTGLTSICTYQNLSRMPIVMVVSNNPFASVRGKRLTLSQLLSGGSSIGVVAVSSGRNKESIEMVGFIADRAKNVSGMD